MKLKPVLLLCTFAGLSLAASGVDMSAVGILERDSKGLPPDDAHTSPQSVKDPSVEASVTETSTQSAVNSGGNSNVYSKLIPCLRRSRHAAGKKIDSLTVPADAEAHYKDLLEKTKIFRNIPAHSWASFKGPWIENYFIERFIDKPFSYFNGLVPLFVQFVDIHVNDFSQNKTESIPSPVQTVDMLMKWLRHDVIYLVVSQDDQGIGLKLQSEFPNILVMSAGGYGHIPIPLIKGVLDFKHPPSRYNWDVGFYGNPRPALARSRMLREFQTACATNRLTYHTSHGGDWVQLMENTKYNLAPRGFGRTSYRLAEIIQAGRIPVYLFDDAKWVPYENTNISLSTFGYSGQMGKLSLTARAIRSSTDAEYSTKITQVRAVRDYYTYEGVLKQIELFFSDPLGDSNYLRCEAVPEKDHRRLEGQVGGNMPSNGQHDEDDVHSVDNGDYC